MNRLFFAKKKEKEPPRSKSKYYLVLIFTIIILVWISNYKNEILKIFYPLNYSNYVFENSQKYDLDPYLVFAIIKAESGFNKNAQSSQGAKGLMQITDSTGEWIAKQLKYDDHSIADLYNPEYNIRMGCWYLNSLIKQFDGDTALAIAAYNAGSGNVQKWLNNYEHSKDGKSLHKIPFGETDRYVIKVKRDYNIYKHIYSGTE